MSDPASPFELEPDDERPKHKPSLPPVDVDPAPAETAVDDSGIDSRTLAERKGEARPRGAAEPVAPPPGWPREALAFPFRRPGPSFLLTGGVGLFLLDLLGTVEALQFPGWVLKLFLLVFLLRAWLHVIATTAAGRDEAHGWSEALNFDFEELWRYARTLALLTVVLLPGFLVWQFGNQGTGVAVFLLGSLYASVIALGAALQDPSLKYPWHALRWMVTRPLHCLVGGAGWWLMATTELVLVDMVAASTASQLAVAVALRALGLILLLICARVLGVMGRAWTAS